MGCRRHGARRSAAEYVAALTGAQGHRLTRPFCAAGRAKPSAHAAVLYALLRSRRFERRAFCFFRADGDCARCIDSFSGVVLGPVHTMSTCALRRQKGHARGAKSKAGRPPGEASQQSAWPFWQQPEGNGRLGPPLFVAFLAQTPSLRFVKRLDWRPKTPVRTCGHSVNRP